MNEELMTLLAGSTDSEDEGEASMGALRYLLQSISENDDDDDDDDQPQMDADDYHNKATEYARKSDHKKAVSICKQGLETFPDNIDLLADVIKYSSEMGDRVTAQAHLDRLMALPRASFNWRAYTFALDFLMEDSVGNEALCKDLISSYQKYLPFEEKAFVAESELASNLGQHSRSLEILEQTLEKMNNAPQCALRLADKQLEQGRFQEASRTVNYAMMASAETQASINVPYLIYVKCLAEDAVLHQRILAGETITPEEIACVRGNYEKLESHFPMIHMKFRSNISNRMNILAFLSD